MQQKFFLGYLSANETNFSQDFVNISLMTKYHPGVTSVSLYIIISEVVHQRKKATDFFSEIVEDCDWIELKEIVFKANLGRDFSSASTFLSMIDSQANADDIIMIRNRSSQGPFMTDWYSSYVSQLKARKKVGLVGSTINFSDLQGLSDNCTHVQTYLYVSFWRCLKDLIMDFPGASEVDRAGIISNGEIALSQRVMREGFLLSCLNWPSYFFSIDYQSDPQLPFSDQKRDVKGLPFLHRENRAQRLRNRLLRYKMLYRFHFMRKNK